MLVTPREAAALISTRDPRTVKRNFSDILRPCGRSYRIDTADLAKGSAAIEAGMNAEVIGMRTGTTAYSARNGARQKIADESALKDAQERARRQV